MASGFLASTLVCRNIFYLSGYDGMTKMHIRKKNLWNRYKYKYHYVHFIFHYNNNIGYTCCKEIMKTEHTFYLYNNGTYLFETKLAV